MKNQALAVLVAFVMLASLVAQGDCITGPLPPPGKMPDGKRILEGKV